MSTKYYTVIERVHKKEQKSKIQGRKTKKGGRSRPTQISDFQSTWGNHLRPDSTMYFVNDIRTGISLSRDKIGAI